MLLFFSFYRNSVLLNTVLIFQMKFCGSYLTVSVFSAIKWDQIKLDPSYLKKIYKQLLL